MASNLEETEPKNLKMMKLQQATHSRESVAMQIAAGHVAADVAAATSTIPSVCYVKNSILYQNVQDGLMKIQIRDFCLVSASPIRYALIV